MNYKRISKGGRCLDAVRIIGIGEENPTPFDKGDFVKVERIRFESVGETSNYTRISILTQYIKRDAFDVEMKLMQQINVDEYEKLRSKAIAMSELTKVVIRNSSETQV